MKKRKTNPTKIHRSQADVEKALVIGQEKGTKGALIVMLYALKDKFGATDDELQNFADAFNYICACIRDGYVTIADLQTVIKEEYGTALEYKEATE